MVLNCTICCDPYTGPGTEHAIYSTICGHLMCKACLETWRNSKTVKSFTCPRCNRKLTKKEYHPIYDLPDEFFGGTDEPETSEKIISDFDIKSDFLKDNSSFQIRFIKRLEQECGGVIRLLDAHNKYLLLVGSLSPTGTEGQFLKIIDCSSGETHHSVNIGNSLCTAVAINKYRDEFLEYMVGFEDGSLIHTTIYSNSDISTAVNREFKENGTIYSICFIGPEKYAYSAGPGVLYITNLSGGTRKDNWYRVETLNDREIVTNISRLTDKSVLGIVRGRIYVFNEYDESYTLCADSGDVIGYAVDDVALMILVFYAKKGQYGDCTSTNQTYVLRRILQTRCKKSEISNRPMFSAFTRKMVSNKDGKFPVPLSSNILVKNLDGDNVYECSLIPNMKTQTLDVVHFADTAKVIGKEVFENMDRCLGANFVSQPEWLVQNELIKLQTAIIFKNNFVIFDIYCSTKI
uniref:RING-type domain-containing protein n=1 Tax=Strongyloides venezuelensis TaxID=75913 RepID=A0A0K0EZ96_STRVS